MKAARAKEHLDNLHSELKTYYATKACEFQRKDDLSNDQYCIRINVKDPPERLSLIAGDFSVRYGPLSTIWCGRCAP